MARNPEQLARLERLGALSVMLVPMRSRGQAVGLFTFASCEAAPAPTGPRIWRWWRSWRAGLAAAVDNARLYREAAGGGAPAGRVPLRRQP